MGVLWMAKEKKKKSIFKRWWFWLIVAIIVIGAISSNDSEQGDTDPSTEANVEEENNDNKDSNNQNNDNTSDNESDDIEEVKIGEPAEIADVIFTVDGVEETDQISSGNEFIDDVTTSGKFVILDVTVENNKNDSITINSSFFTIYTDDGKEYDVNSDGEVMMAMGDAMDDFFLTKINPGLSKSGKIVFEVGEDVDVSKSTLKAQTGFWGTETVEVKLYN